MGVVTTRLSTLRRSAYRQAGRAVLCILYHRGFYSVAISGAGRFQEELRLAPLKMYNEDSGRMYSGKAQREIIIDIGGPVAERLATQHREWTGTGRYMLRAGHAIEIASQICDDHETARAYLKYLWLQTRNMLERREHWAVVQALAAELIDGRSVSAPRAREIFRQTR